jgi:hypothetical protein
LHPPKRTGPKHTGPKHTGFNSNHVNLSFDGKYPLDGRKQVRFDPFSSGRHRISVQIISSATRPPHAAAARGAR